MAPSNRARRRGRLSIAVLPLLLACGNPGDPPATRTQSAAYDGGTQTERARVLGPFLSAHWTLPVPLQGKPPDTYSPVEASLDPAACGACHPQQLAQWQESLHAAAFSPGFAGQLIEGDLAEPTEIRQCQRCHAPLSEQQPFTAAGAPQPAFDAALRTRGLTCAGCHVRSHQRFGPPRRSELPPLPSAIPHAGFEEREEYTESRFCAECHQFFDDPGVAGKPLENTYAEWLASPQAAEGATCQSCHMPERAHLWRGIHDAEMVRAGVAVDFVPADMGGERLRAALVLANRGVGHFFPTYVTPRIFLAAWQVDAQDRPIEGTRVQAAIGREVDLTARPPREVFDTRVAPGESVKLDYAVERSPVAAALMASVSVDPDYHYRGVYAYLLGTLGSPEAREKIRLALERSKASRYVLAEWRHNLEEKL